MTVAHTSEVNLASLDRRVNAAVVDRAIAWGLLALSGIGAWQWFWLDGRALPGILLVVGVWLLLGLIFAVALGSRGVSPGRAVVGIRVIDVETGKPIGIPRALKRTVLTGLSALPLFGLGLATLAWTAVEDRSGGRRGWHDYRAGSVVVDVRPKQVVEVAEEPGPAHIVNLTAMRLKPVRREVAPAPVSPAATADPPPLSTPAPTPPPAPAPTPPPAPAPAPAPPPTPAPAPPRVPLTPVPPPAPGWGQGSPAAPPGRSGQQGPPAPQDRSGKRRGSRRRKQDASGGPVPHQPMSQPMSQSQPWGGPPPNWSPPGPPPGPPSGPPPGPPSGPPPGPPSGPPPGPPSGPPKGFPAGSPAGSSAGSSTPPQRPMGAPRPRWRVSFDSGAVFVVEGLGLVGRAPEGRPGEPVMHSVPLISDNMSVSKTHAQFHIGNDGALVVMDRGSTNGSLLIRSGVTRELSPGRPATLLAGDLVRFGDREMRVERAE